VGIKACLIGILRLYSFNNRHTMCTDIKAPLASTADNIFHKASGKKLNGDTATTDDAVQFNYLKDDCGGVTMPSQITILGSGTCVPSLSRNPCSFLMQTGAENLLFDCGSGVMRRLLEIGVAIFDISHIFLSHFHPDHVGELAAFLFALKYPAPSAQKQPLTIVAGRGFSDFFDRLKTVYGDWIVLPSGMFSVIELDTTKADRRSLATVDVFSMPVAHRPESLAYRIVDAQGKALVYSGDSDVCDNLTAIAADAEVMICESAFPDEQKVAGHLTASQAGKIAQAAAVKRLVLTHFYPACEDADIENQCRSTYYGKVILARDMMAFTL
jgi:ribonuclease BN (tRNA processing enzyme)